MKVPEEIKIAALALESGMYGWNGKGGALRGVGSGLKGRP